MWLTGHQLAISHPADADAAASHTLDQPWPEFCPLGRVSHCGQLIKNSATLLDQQPSSACLAGSTTSRMPGPVEVSPQQETRAHPMRWRASPGCSIGSHGMETVALGTWRPCQIIPILAMIGRSAPAWESLSV